MYKALLILFVALFCAFGSSQSVDFQSTDDGFVGYEDPPYPWSPDFPDVIRIRSPKPTDVFPTYYFYGFSGWNFPANRTEWQISSAILTFSFNVSDDPQYSSLVASGKPMTFGLCTVTDGWDSNVLNWNNSQKFWSDFTTIATPTIPSVSTGKMNIDLKATLNAWLPSHPSPAWFTVVMQASDSDETDFASRRSAVYPGPVLQITFASPPGTASPIATPPIVAPTVLTPTLDNVNQPLTNGTVAGVDALAVGLGVSLSVAGAAAIFVGVFFGVKKMQKKKKKDEEELTSTTSVETIYAAVPSVNGSPSGTPNNSNTKTVILASEFKLDKEIGSGNYGKVYIAKFNNAKVAVKYYHQIEALKDFQHEADLLCKMKPHPNIVQLIGICTDGPQPAIVLEYCNGGSLDKYLESNPNLEFKERIKLMYGTACGVYHLHINDIVHRDLAARNILLNRGQPKISDFGMSRFVTSNDKMGHTKTNIGPLKWMAPESIKNQDYSPKSDVWMFANICFEIMTGKMPFEGEDIFAVGLDIRDNGAHETMPEGTDPRLVKIVEACWQKDPKDRVSMETIIAEFEQKFDFLNDSETD